MPAATFNLNQVFTQLKNSLPLENQSRLSVFVGGQGSGKSWSAMSIAEAVMGKEFDPKKHVAYFDGWDFLDVVRHAKKGSVVIFDDCGVGIDSRLWMTQSNIVIAQLVQIFRTDNLWVIFTTPSINYIDKKVRPMFHDFVLFQGKPNVKEGYASAKWYDFTENKFTGEFFFRPTVIDGRSLEHIKFSTPSNRVTKVYEEARDVAKMKLRDKADAIRRGAGRSATVDQVAKMLKIDVDLLWATLGKCKGLIPLDTDSRGLKISLSWVGKVSEALGIDVTQRNGETLIVSKGEGNAFANYWPLNEEVGFVYDINPEKKIPLMCTKCGYIWSYNGSARDADHNPTCPKCNLHPSLLDALLLYYNMEKSKGFG